MFKRTTFRKVAELLPDSVVLTDNKGRITWTNSAFHELCGYSKSFVAGRKPGSFLQGPETDQKTVSYIRKAIENQVSIDAELINYHQDGSPYWVSLRITPIKAEDGELEGFLAIERDITYARNRERHLENEVGKIYSTLVDLISKEN